MPPKARSKQNLQDWWKGSPEFRVEKAADGSVVVSPHIVVREQNGPPLPTPQSNHAAPVLPPDFTKTRGGPGDDDRSSSPRGLRKGDTHAESQDRASSPWAEAEGAGLDMDDESFGGLPAPLVGGQELMCVSTSASSLTGIGLGMSMSRADTAGETDGSDAEVHTDAPGLARMYYSPRTRMAEGRPSSGDARSSEQKRATQNALSATADAHLNEQAEIDKSWSFAAVERMMLDVRAAVEEQVLLLVSLADEGDPEDPGCYMLKLRSLELTRELEGLEQLLEAGVETAESGVTIEHMSPFSITREQALRERGNPPAQTTNLTDVLRLRASAVYSALKSLDAQAKKLTHVSRALPTMRPALHPLIAGLKREKEEQQKLLQHTIRQLEGLVSKDEQQAWLHQAGVDARSIPVSGTTTLDPTPSQTPGRSYSPPPDPENAAVHALDRARAAHLATTHAAAAAHVAAAAAATSNYATPNAATSGHASGTVTPREGGYTSGNSSAEEAGSPKPRRRGSWGKSSSRSKSPGGSGRGSRSFGFFGAPAIVNGRLTQWLVPGPS